MRLDLKARPVWSQFAALAERPAVRTPGEPRFWTDPHIAGQMLQAHLNPDTDAASRRPETIGRTVEWICNQLQLCPGQAVIDLGCGPGLYCRLLATKGLEVTGMDFSQNSLAYARRQAEQAGLAIRYLCQDYLALDHQAEYDVAMIIYYDLCVLSDPERDRLLRNVHRALKPGGRLVLDLVTKFHWPHGSERRSWSLSAGGFWRPGPHLVLTQALHYPEADCWLDQHIVVDEQAQAVVYRLWHRYYTRESFGAVLEANGFASQGCWTDLTGTPYSESAASLAVVAGKR